MGQRVAGAQRNWNGETCSVEVEHLYGRRQLGFVDFRRHVLHVVVKRSSAVLHEVEKVVAVHVPKVVLVHVEHIAQINLFGLAERHAEPVAAESHSKVNAVCVVLVVDAARECKTADRAQKAFCEQLDSCSACHNDESDFKDE